MQAEEKILPIHVGMALKSLRNSDFDPYSAICEVIDNSIEADAKEIRISIDSKKPEGKRVERPVSIAFGDDGLGMDKKTLQLCLKLGYSERYDNRTGIGRFGVGMTLGAISLCQKIEVYSRQKRGNWHYTFLDISKIDENTEPSIHHVEQRDLPKDYENLVGDNGTLVIWSKIDRIDSDFKEEELKFHLGRIYRKFIGEEIIKDKKAIRNPKRINIYLNKEIIPAHDPLYVTKNPKFPDDKRATLDDEITFSWKVHDVDQPTSGVKSGNITIRMSLLPESWRLYAGAGGSNENRQRHVDENQGFSILRNGREVFYGEIYNLLATKDLDRFWGCEIDFDPVLDHWFSVRNIKIGARPLKELREKLYHHIYPIVQNKFRKKIQERFADTQKNENKSNSGPVLGHKGKEEEIKHQTSPLKTNLSEEEIKKNIDKYAEDLFDNPEEQEQYKHELRDPDIPFKFIEDQKARADSQFIDVVPNLGKKVVHYNMNHPFWLSIYTKITKIKTIAEANKPENLDLIKIANELKDDLDNLVYSYAEGIYDLDDLNKLQKVNDTLEELMVKWSLHLRKTYKI